MKLLVIQNTCANCPANASARLCDIWRASGTCPSK